MPIPALHIGDLAAKVPIIQGGMGIRVSLSKLASAVANEGAIGVIAGAMVGIHDPNVFKNPRKANSEALAQEIRKAKEMTNGILGVNIMVALSDFSELVKVSIKERIDIIFAGAGLPLDLPQYVSEEVKTKLVPIISSGRAAKLICKKWLAKFNYLPDAFVVEGPLAGGHLGFKPQQLDDPAFGLERLVPEVLEAVKPFEDAHGRKIPVVAAGGVYSGEDICKYLKLGAAGVQMGTRFVATHECDVDPAFKQAYIDSSQEDIGIIQSPVGMPGRALLNAFLHDVKAGKKFVFKCPYHCITPCDYTKAPYCISSALANAQKGRLKSGFAFAGGNAHRVKEIVSVKELIDSLKERFLSCCPA
ncbi:nitronate monooxygenase [candidate division KSB3 bacterium]|uniref:Nitronate monooxygenase n=1 Tax=candidate division KSB3 bacterium TaxID=2044937 RepID=A0A2G6KF56_9BACT|nr:MAG: nitronate monooxygenase [candidate division KSB3 bacterium]